MQTVSLKITKATLITRSGTDILTLSLDAPPAFPTLGYQAEARIETTKGYAEKWCSLMGISIDSVVNT